MSSDTTKPGIAAASAAAFDVHTSGHDPELCNFPGCRRPRRPVTSTTGGKPPLYCDLLRPGTDKYAHTALTASRERDRRARQHGAAQAAAEETPAMQGPAMPGEQQEPPAVDSAAVAGLLRALSVAVPSWLTRAEQAQDPEAIDEEVSRRTAAAEEVASAAKVEAPPPAADPPAAPPAPP